MCFQPFLLFLRQLFHLTNPRVVDGTQEATNTVSLCKRPSVNPDHVQLFLEAVLALPIGQRLDPFLQTAVRQEENLRRIFATDRGHPDLVDPFAGLFDIFAQDQDIWKVIGRPIGEHHNEHFIMPLASHLRKKPGSLSIVPTLSEFEQNWNIFTHNILSNISWNNVMAAGGSVLACLEPFEGDSTTKQRNTRYQSIFAASDIDLFLYGLNATQAKAKMVEIYEAISNTVPFRVICVRKPNVVSIHTLFPARPVQIILRLYLSPAEILAGFDVDSACFAYDGQRVWTNPRALASCIRQANTVDLTRRSPSYEVRLAKYAERGYEVYLPYLSRQRIDPSIFRHPSPKRPNGLARLLVLEQVYFNDSERRNVLDYPWKKVLRQGAAYAGPGRRLNINFQSCDYDVAWVVPYGPAWTAGKIATSVTMINYNLNGSWPLTEAGRRLHRHPLYAGSMRACIEDFCPACPSPCNEGERQLVASESGKYIRGPVRFMEMNPGQQLLTGSFQPLDAKGWEADAYGLDDISDYGLSELFSQQI